MPELALEGSDFESRAISPFRAIECLRSPWVEPTTTFSCRCGLPVVRAASRRTSCSGRRRATAGFAPRTRQRAGASPPTPRPDVLASPGVNRKKHHDAAQWMPSMNRCWFAARVAEARRKYALTVGAREANALERVPSGCASTEDDRSKLQGRPVSRGSQSSAECAVFRHDRCIAPAGRQRKRTDYLPRCAPALRGHPAYAFMHDGDSGVVCEQLRSLCTLRL